MVRIPAATLDDAFALASHNYIFLIGGGGKTTLMYTLAHHLASSGRTVVSTTSTKILVPPPTDAACVIVESDPNRAVIRLRSELATARHVTLGKVLSVADRKLLGFSADELDYLQNARIADYLLVEADGAGGRSLKAHADYEPVISPHADLVIVVIGSDCIGCPLSDAQVHRAELFGRLLNRPLGAPVRVGDIAAMVFHPLGYLKAVPPGADVIVLISKVSDAARRPGALQLAAALRAADHDRRITHIVMGELAGPTPWIEPVG